MLVVCTFSAKNFIIQGFEYHTAHIFNRKIYFLNIFYIFLFLTSLTLIVMDRFCAFLGLSCAPILYWFFAFLGLWRKVNK